MKIIPSEEPWVAHEVRQGWRAPAARQDDSLDIPDRFGIVERLADTGTGRRRSRDRRLTCLNKERR